ncbi:antirestriction protein ArdA [Brevibacillus agri]|nr:antirestriction protein ArdA [Brevibacillus agri]MDN4094564.1 antirestriction protein ArdA [Brevibacillus agri]
MNVKLYVAKLAKYNEGKLVGEWLTLPMSPEKLAEQLRCILGWMKNTRSTITKHFFALASMITYTKSIILPLCCPNMTAGLSLRFLNVWTTWMRL